MVEEGEDAAFFCSCPEGPQRKQPGRCLFTMRTIDCQRRRTASARWQRWVPLIVTAWSLQCTPSPVQSTGRPCSLRAPCSGDNVCHPISRICVQLNRDARIPDLPPADQPRIQDLSPAPDLRLDLRADAPGADLLRDLDTPDAGCPPGLTLCGLFCKSLTSDQQHCGKCFSPCDLTATDTCDNSQCVCGVTGAPCPAGLDCVGGQCRCITSGRCAGCCSGESCLPLGSGQSGDQCGEGARAARCVMTR